MDNFGWLFAVLLVAGCPPPATPAVDILPATGDREAPDDRVAAPPSDLGPWMRPAKLRRNGDGPIPLSERDPIRGPELAPLTLLLFTDFECPACGLAKTVIADLQTAEPQLRVVLKHFPLPAHPHAKPAAMAATAVLASAGERAFWQFHDGLFDLAMSSGLPAADMATLANKAGVAPAAFEEALAMAAVSAKVDADVALAGRLGVAYVPYTLLNCKLVDTMEPAELRAAVDAELAQVDAARAGGVEPGRMYASRCRANFQR